jgi:hypothetical protein
MTTRGMRELIIAKEVGETKPIMYLGLLGFMVLVSVLLNFGELRRLFREPFRERVLYADEIEDRGVQLSKSARLEGAFAFSERGLTLKPGEAFKAVFAFSKKTGEDVALYTGLRGYEDVTNRIEVLLPDGRGVYFPSHDYSASQKVPLPDDLRDAHEFSIVVSAARRAGPSSQPILVFDALKVVTENRAPLVNLPALIAAIAASLTAYSLIIRWKKLCGYAAVVSVAIFSLLLIEVHYAKDLYFPATFAALCAIVLGWFFYARKPDYRLLRVMLRYSVLFIVVFALRLRWDALPDAMAKPLSPDAATYADLARQMRGVFDTGVREPLFIWSIKLFFWLFGDNNSNLQLMTLVFSLVTIVLTYLCAAGMFGSLVGLLGALFLASGRIYMYENLRGLRLELYTLIVLALLLLLSCGTKIKPFRRALMLGFVCGFAFLNSLSSISYVVLLVIYFGLRQRSKWWHVVAPLVIGLGMVSPHLLYNKREYGDLFYSSNIHARFYRNMEFQDQPGFPTSKDVERDKYAGNRISTAGYIFGLHSIPDVIRRSLVGFGRTYFGEYLRTPILDNNLTLYFVYLLGLLMLVVRRQFDFLVVMFLLNVPSFFFAGTKTVDFDFRLTMHDIGLIMMCMSLGLITGFGLLARTFEAAKTLPGKRFDQRQEKQNGALRTS